MQPKHKVLVIEDDEDIRDSLMQVLGETYDVFMAVDGIEGIKEAIRQPPDIILLDIMMPRLDGYQTCQALRQEKVTSGVPILMLTALKNTDERIRAFNAGADDYISKPFDQDELMIRMESKLRRFRELTTAGLTRLSKQLECGNLLLDLDSFEAWLEGKAVKLSLLEFKLVRYLIENRGHLRSRDEILEVVWETNEKSGRILDTHIMTIRKKLAGFDHVISSVYGGGYLLRVPTQVQKKQATF